jgi:hypothetical protein
VTPALIDALAHFELTLAIVDALAHFGLTRPIFIDFEYYAPPGCNRDRSASPGYARRQGSSAHVGCGTTRSHARSR